MSKNILLNCLPPTLSMYASPAFSVLKSFLQERGFSVKVKYWNLSMYTFFKNYLNSDESIDLNEKLKLIPFNVYYAIEKKDNELLEKIAYFVLSENSYLHSKGINHIKSMLIQKNRLLNELIDTELSHISWNDKLYIGFSSQFYQWIFAVIIARKIKKINPGIPVVIGGFGTRKEALAFMNNFDNFDYATWGEGESIALSISEYLSNSTTQTHIKDIPNIIYREENALKTNIGRNKYVDLDDLNFDVSDYVEQVKHLRLKYTYIPVESSRGCHWKKCRFCYLNDGYKYRIKKNETVINELREVIRKHKIYKFTFLDNDLIGQDLTRFNDFLDNLIDLRNKYNDFTINMAEIVTKGVSYEIIEKMAIAHFHGVQIGYESPSDNLLRKINKKNTFASNFFFIKWALKFGIRIEGVNILRNLPEETDDDIKEAIRNLYYCRFFFSKDFSHKYSYLSISECSKYFKNITQTGKLAEWGFSNMRNMLPDDLIRAENLHTLFLDWIKLDYNKLWDTFEKVEKHYINNKYDYSLYKNKQCIYYREWYNHVLLKEFEFDTRKIHWFILVHCNKKIVGIDELIAQGNPSEDKNQYLTAINELQDEGLIYHNDDYSEIVTVIDTSLVN